MHRSYLFEGPNEGQTRSCRCSAIFNISKSCMGCTSLWERSGFSGFSAETSGFGLILDVYQQMLSNVPLFVSTKYICQELCCEVLDIQNSTSRPRAL